MQTTKLSTLLNRMDRYQSVYTTEEQFKVRDLDEALRTLKRTTQPPWTLKKSTLRIFEDVLEYPTAPDHNSIYYLDKQQTNNRTFSSFFNDSARFFFTSIKEFYEDPDYRNDLAEIWDGGTRYLGVRLDDLDTATSSLVDSSSVLSRYTGKGDASGLVIDTVNYKDSNTSIRFTNTPNTGSAEVEIAFPLIADGNYKQKYFFIYVYLTGLPTSITLEFGNDDSNLLRGSVTKQFSGQSFKVNDWNLLAIDLNTATVVGTINTSQFDYASVTLIGAPAGVYFINSSYLREWVLLDYWYYTTFNCATSGSNLPNQDYFMDDNEAYDLSTVLVGDEEWADVVMYDAILSNTIDVENDKVITGIEKKRQTAWDSLMETYPSGKQLITTRKMNFTTDFNSDINI